jgi:opacity protein-like surface antigen
MRRWFFTGAAIALLNGTAFAQTTGTYLTAESGPQPPATISTTQPIVSQAQSIIAGNALGAAYGYEFGGGFRTEIEGVTSRPAAERLRQIPASGSRTTTSVMLNSFYEFSDGAWHMKPYVGAGFGVVDVNERVLGVSGNDWATAYQVRGGVTMGFTQALLGSLEYRWTMGSKPHFSLAGIPTKVEVDRHGFVVGFTYKY